MGDRRAPGRLCHHAATLGLLLALAACGRMPPGADSAPDEPRGDADVPDAVPRVEPKSRYGNPPSYVVMGRRYEVMNSSRGYVERGIASWYGTKFHGRKTSNGEVYDMYAMTAAHKALPLPTYVSVTNLENGRRIVLRVNDRGPFHENRLIDLSYSAARKLDIVRKGTGYVEVRALDAGQPAPPAGPVIAKGRPPGGVKLFLQAGAYALRDNAQRVFSRLQSLGTGLVRMTEAVVAGRSVFRVRLGPLSDVEQADRLTRQILDMGMDRPGIVLE
jgi:rare lipoprotein A